jgi:cellulose biosynthesis protein BcsQ
MSADIKFDNVLGNVADILNRTKAPLDKTVVVRDIYGRIRILFNIDETEKAKQSEFLKCVEEELRSLGCYGSHSALVFCTCDLMEPELFFNDPDILTLVLPRGDEYITLRLLERQVVGQDWRRPKIEPRDNPIPRLAFYGFKGGVGRSTTVAAVAFLLAQSGKNVLVFDFDLESPGLSSMLLPSDQYPTYGVVDWLVEDMVDNVDDHLLQYIVAASPLAKNFDRDIKIVSAMGAKTDDPRVDPNYISKLSRIYAAKPRNEGGIELFSDRLERLVETIEKQVQPDVVLIDCRAGLHDLSAGSIVRIADEAFLFIVDTPQSWEGYRMLFSHWNQCPELLVMIRDKLNIVQSMIPANDQEERKTRFLENSYLLFSETIYEQSDPTQYDPDRDAPYNFDKDMQEAPHYSTDIFWSSSLSEFDFRSFENRPTQEVMELTYTPIFEKVRQILQGYANE